MDSESDEFNQVRTRHLIISMIIYDVAFHNLQLWLPDYIMII